MLAAKLQLSAPPTAALVPPKSNTEGSIKGEFLDCL